MTDDAELVKRLRELSLTEELSGPSGRHCHVFSAAAAAIERLAAERDAAWQAGALAMREAAARVAMAKQRTWIGDKMVSEIDLGFDTDLSGRIRAISPDDVRK